MSRTNDAARRQLAYVGKCLAGPMALENAALSQLDLLRGDIDADDIEPDLVDELPPVVSRRRRLRELQQLLAAIGRRPRGDHQCETDIAFARRLGDGLASRHVGAEVKVVKPSGYIAYSVIVEMRASVRA